ncbi:MAG TPA: hypothetical protein PK147_08510 [Saprospiraceae bacterium]|nr:hypothetical protein [Saprospiraceae bacterium]MCB9327737.1 hypothetical protein [Lewinellaceae bacterium]HPQ21879.1 hypothetical protein [Saprospiraceae bacterium]
MKALSTLVILFSVVFVYSCKNDSVATSEKPVENTEVAQDNMTSETSMSNQTQSESMKDRETMPSSSREERDASLISPNVETSSKMESQTKNQPSKAPLEVGGYAVNGGYMDGQGLFVPDACSLLNTSWLAGVLGVNESQIQVKDGSDSHMPNAKACFFKYDDEDLGNAGILLQVMTNPVHDEFPEWVSQFVNAKITDGEQDYTTTNELYKYKPWKALGDGGAYSSELSKYHWRLGNNYLFLLAFNLDKSEDDKLAMAQKIGNKVLENFNEVVKNKK